MSLTNMESSSGELIATGADASAVSKSLYPIGAGSILINENLKVGLVSHFLLNSNADDSHGTFDGTATGGVDFQGDVASLDGVDDAISISASALTGTSGTISLWFKGDGKLLSKAYSINTDHVTFIDFDTGSSIVFFIKTTGVRTTLTVTTSLTSSDLIHLVVVSTGSAYKIYVNGVDTSFTVTEGSDDGKWFGDLIASDTNSIGILDWFAVNESFLGDISNFRIYSDAKNQAFIDDLYAEGYYPKPLTEPTTTGLIAHYPLTGTAEDSTGNYDGIETGGFTHTDDVEYGAVGSFNNISSLIDTGIAQSVSSTYTFSVWINPNSDGNYKGAFGDHITIGIVGFQVAGGVWQFGAGTSGGMTLVNLPAITLNTWTHLTGQVTATKVSVSVNGLFNIETALLGTFSPSGNILIGRSFDGSDRYFDGEMRDFRVYTTVLTQQEITDIYNYEKNFRSIDIDDGLIAYYPLANNSLDNYYNEYDGTDTSMTYDGDSGVFNGATSYIELETEYTQTSGAVSFWFKADAIGDAIRYIGSVGTDAASLEVLSILGRLDTASKLTIYSNTFNSVEQDKVVSTQTLSADTLYHIIIQSDGTAWEMYINGVSETLIIETGTNSGVWTSDIVGANRFTIGALGRNTTTNFFDGSIGNLRVYNKALTPEQIEVIYDSERTNFMNFSSLRNIKADYEYQNISTATVPDILTSNLPISTGDNLVIVKDDNSIHEAVADIYKDDFTLIDINTVHTDLPLFSDDSELDTTARYTDPTYGIGWGESADAWAYNYIYITDLKGADSFEITYTGNYINLGLGDFIVQNADTDEVLIQLTDSWASDSQGQSLTINGATIFSQSTINIVNRIDTVQLNGATSIKIGMKGYSGVTYNKRYIKDLILKNSGYNMDTTAITAGEIPSTVFLIESKLSFDDTSGFKQASNLNNVYDFSRNNYFRSTETYNNVSLEQISPTVKTKVELKNTGDKCTLIDFDAWNWI